MLERHEPGSTAVDTGDNSAAASRSFLFWGAALGTAALLVVMAVPHFRGRTYARDDLLAYHLPVRQFYSDCLARGDRFDWMPSLFCGFYLTGEGQAGTYHPFHWLIYFALPLRTAFDLELLVSYPALLLGTFVLLRRQGLCRGAALFGGMVFAFCGFNLRHAVHLNAIEVIAHVPWLLWCLTLTMDAKRDRRWPWPQCGIALLTASQILIGYPQYVWFSVLAESSYLCMVYPPSWARMRRYSEVTFLKLTGLGIGAVQWFPTWDALQHSLRATHGPGFAGTGLHPVNVLQIFAPYVAVPGQSMHEFVLYVGSLPLMLGLWLLLGRRWKESNVHQLTKWAVFLGIFALWMSFGNIGLLYQLQSFLPVVGQFRLPARYTVLVALAAAVLAALSIEMIVRGQSRTETLRRGIAPATIWLPVVSLILTIECLFVWNHWNGGWAAVLAGPLWFAVGGAVLWSSVRRQRWAFAALPLLMAADLGLYGLPYAFVEQTPKWEQLTCHVGTPPGRNEGRVITERQLVPGRPTEFTGNQIVLAGWDKADGYFGLIPRRKLIGEHTSLNGLRVANVHWVTRTGKNAEIVGLKPHSESWLRVPDPLPRFRLLTESRVSSRPAQAIRNIDPEHVAIVEKPVVLKPGKSGQCQVVADRPGFISLRTQTDSRQLLVAAESHHAGWRAEIDGTPTEIVRVYGQFMGITVPPGTHAVQLRFRPASLRHGKLISAVSFLVTVLYAGIRAFFGRSD